MNKNERERIYNLYGRLEALGFNFQEVETMRRISKTLSRWCEAECNGDIERDEVTNKPRRCSWFSSHGTYHQGYPVPDRESGAIKRMDKLMSDHPDLGWYYQTDPRGCAVYVYQLSRLETGQEIDSLYSSIGIAVY